MHPCLLDVLHHATNEGDTSGVTHAVHIALNGVGQEAVQQHGRVVAYLDGFAHVALQVALLVHDFHRAATQHVAGAHHEGIAQSGCLFQGFDFGAGRGVRWLLQTQVVQQLLEALAVFGGVNHVGRGADDWYAFGFETQSKLERRLAAVLHDHADRLFLVHDLQHVFERDGLEVQAVGGVVVGGHGLRVAVDHDGFIAVFAHGKRGMHAAVVELDALTDAVRATAQHHDLLVAGRCGFALRGGAVRRSLVGRVQVCRVGGELCGTGVHALVHRAHLVCTACFTYRFFGGLEQLGQAAIREALLLEGEQRASVQRSQGALTLLGDELVDVEFDLHDLLDLHQEPLVDLGEVMHLVHRQAHGKRVTHVPDTLGARLAQLFF